MLYFIKFKGSGQGQSGELQPRPARGDTAGSSSHSSAAITSTTPPLDKLTITRKENP